MSQASPEVKLEKEIAVTTPAEMIRQAVSGGADLEKLEKLLELQERWEANEAKKAYHKAMSAFKADPPEIEKDKKVEFKTSSGMTRYHHATLANVTERINEGLSKHGLSASWNVKQNGAVSVTCKITHEQGHSEETTLTAPPDGSGSKNPIQAIGSTISYLERYTLLALTGLATFDMDTDGRTDQDQIKMPEVVKSDLKVPGASKDSLPSANRPPAINSPQKAPEPKKGQVPVDLDLPEASEAEILVFLDSEYGQHLLQIADKNGLPESELKDYIAWQTRKCPIKELVGKKFKEIETWISGGFNDIA